MAGEWLVPGPDGTGGGLCVGAIITATWLLNGSGIAELSDQVSVRTGLDEAAGGRSFGFGEFLSRQWDFATDELLVPPWLRVLLVPALLAGLIDRRTRVATAITLAMAATLTFGFQQGAWTHRLWNFPWLAPVTIGFGSLLDAARRVVPARVRAPAAAAAAAVVAATMVAVVAGGTRDRYLSDPAHLGTALEQAADTSQAVRQNWLGRDRASPLRGGPRTTWTCQRGPSTRGRLEELENSDLVIVRASMFPNSYLTVLWRTRWPQRRLPGDHGRVPVAMTGASRPIPDRGVGSRAYGSQPRASSRVYGATTGASWQ